MICIRIQADACVTSFVHVHTLTHAAHAHALAPHVHFALRLMHTLKSHTTRSSIACAFSRADLQCAQ